MKQDRKVISLDIYEEGAILEALKDLRNKEISEQKSPDFTGDLLLKIIRAPTQKVKVRNEAR